MKTEPNSPAGSGCPAAPCSAIYRDMWAVVFPDGHIVTGSDMDTEADAWRIALGWPGPEEIEDAMKRGAFAVKARLRYYSPNNLAQRVPVGAKILKNYRTHPRGDASVSFDTGPRAWPISAHCKPTF